MSGTVPGRAWRVGDCLHVDTRGLGPPDPLVAILWHVENGARRIVAHLDRDPVHLYPELAERGWTAEPLEGAPGEVRLLLRPAP